MTIGFSVLYNLVFLLTVFLSSEGVKNYKGHYSWVIMAVGALQFVRILGIPRMAHSTILNLNGVDTVVMNNKQFLWVCICLVISGIACIISGIVSAYKVTTLNNYLKEKGLA